MKTKAIEELLKASKTTYTNLKKKLKGGYTKKSVRTTQLIKLAEDVIWLCEDNMRLKALLNEK